jgi:hypothetical protein
MVPRTTNSLLTQGRRHEYAVETIHVSGSFFCRSALDYRHGLCAQAPLAAHDTVFLSASFGVPWAWLTVHIWDFGAPPHWLNVILGFAALFWIIE